MQLGEFTDAHANMIVLLGGLAMPKTEINPEEANEIARKVLENLDKGRIIGLLDYVFSPYSYSRNGIK
jgi:hypothetical protein